MEVEEVMSRAEQYASCLKLMPVTFYFLCSVFLPQEDFRGIAPGCSELSDPMNGFVSVRDLTIGATADYSCYSDFRLVGPTRLTCLPTGRWDNTPPVCERRAATCPRLAFPINGYVTQPDRATSGQEAFFYCSQGYELKGSQRLFCLREGYWNTTSPTCTQRRVVNCLIPAEITNGDVSYRVPIIPGNTVKYSCRAGYQMMGSADLTCKDNGEWDNGFPACVQRQKCETPRQPRNGILDVTFSGETGQYTPGTYIRVVCDSGYSVQADSSGLGLLVCVYGGQWSANIPDCVSSQTASCQQLSDPRNGRVTIQGTGLGSLASFSCSPGFILVGPPRLTCTPNGLWDRSPPTCDYQGNNNNGGSNLFCPILTIAHGSVTYNDKPINDLVPVGTEVRLVCEPNYRLRGSTTSTCSAQGWLGAAICESFRGNVELATPITAQCSRPVDPVNGEAIFSTLRPGALVTYHCNQGYLMVGDIAARCDTRGGWSSEPPLCKEVSCPRPGDVQNGIVQHYCRGQAGGCRAGDHVVVTCSRRYELIGYRNVTCLSIGHWTDWPICQQIDYKHCAFPIVIPNGRLGYRTNQNGDVNRVGEYVQVECDHGYRLEGPPEVTCVDQDEWSPTPVCRPDTRPPVSGPGGKLCDNGPTIPATAPLNEVGYSVDSSLHIFPDLKFSCSGRLRSWLFYAVSRQHNLQNVYLDVWRPSGNDFNLVTSSAIQVESYGVNLVPSPIPVEVRSGDVIGYHYSSLSTPKRLLVVPAARQQDPWPFTSSQLTTDLTYQLNNDALIAAGRRLSRSQAVSTSLRVPLLQAIVAAD